MGVADDRARRPFEIFVNRKPIKVTEKEMSGLQIKEAAIKQGVNIQLDFVLFQDLSNGQQVIVKDHQKVRIRDGLKFEAITNDDNS
jgi:hypothetical protein